MRANIIKPAFKIKRPVLAFGSQSKNTLCYVGRSAVCISRVHADLNNPKDFIEFQKDARRFLKKKPQAIAYDYHPEYSSSSFALCLLPFSEKAFPVYHHHAHIASCMAENGIKNQKVLGVAFDGTGLGQDNAIWGAEFLSCDYAGFKRLAHLKEIPLAGAQQAIYQPWRLAAFWLYQVFGSRFSGLKVSWLDKLDLNKWRIISSAAQKGINSPLASSAGRLFDAAASLILGKMHAEYEAQLPIELEKLAVQGARGKGQEKNLAYSFKIEKDKEQYVIDPAGIFKGIISDLKKRKPKIDMAYRFHFTTAVIIKKMVVVLRKENRINKVVLSGGVFQNKLLLGMIRGMLNKSGFEVFCHKQLPPNDASLSLGQAVIAAFKG